MLLYTPFFHISTHFSFSRLFGSPVSQRHVPVDVPLTQTMLLLHQHQVGNPSTLFKPMNQRVFVRSFVKFLTKSHSFSVSIEASKPFPWLLHSFLAIFQSFTSRWKEYLEQTVTISLWETDRLKRRKKQTRKNYLFTYLLIVYIIQELEEAAQKENWIKPSDTHKS